MTKVVEWLRQVNCDYFVPRNDGKCEGVDVVSKLDVGICINI